MIPTPGPVVVLGVGNVMLRDDGVGVRIVEALRRLTADDPAMVPDATRLVDGGTLGLGLLEIMRGARSLLVLDAINLGLEAGTIRVMRGEAIAAAGPSAVPGTTGTAGAVGDRPASGSMTELLAVGRLMGWLPDPVTLVGVQVGDTEFGVGLSPRVEAALPDAVEVARTELRALYEGARAGRSAIWVARHQEEATA
jgi:hydrogenase maturation protease